MKANRIVKSAASVPGFKTTAGYDLTTGLGSPNAYWFVHDLADTP